MTPSTRLASLEGMGPLWTYLFKALGGNRTSYDTGEYAMSTWWHSVGFSCFSYHQSQANMSTPRPL